MQPPGKPLLFRIAKGGHVSHFHARCPQWPRSDYYEQEKPLWWGQVCPLCSRLEEEDARVKGWPPQE